MLTCGPRIGITVTAKAYAAIKATLPADTQTWPHRPGDQGDVVIWLDQATVDRLAAMRGPGESYSDAIIPIARGRGAPRRKSHAVALSPIKRRSVLQRPL